MLALESVKHSLLASSRSAGLMAGLDTDTRLRHNIWKAKGKESHWIFTWRVKEWGRDEWRKD